MHPRLRFDITWRDLARAAGFCVWSAGDVAPPLGTDAGQEAIVTLSVRSAFDLLLTALDLPAGAEVLLSEITVPHVPQIAREHGLTVAAIKIDPRTLEVDLDDLAARVSDRTRVMMVAHLFGARASLGAVGEFARRRGILLVEDCAQALTSGRPERDPAADVSLYSFGPIKTATALGGGIALINDRTLRDRMITAASSWPRQTTFDYFARVTKISLLKLLTYRAILAPLVALLTAVGVDADRLVSVSARAFPDEKLFAQLRRRPCPALKHLLAHRLAQFDKSRITDRTRRGRQLASQIEPAAFAAGCENPTHTFWVFPAVCREPERTVCALRAAGFDASQHSGLTVVGEGEARPWFRQVVFLPHGDPMPQGELNRAAEILRQENDERPA